MISAALGCSLKNHCSSNIAVCRYPVHCLFTDALRTVTVTITAQAVQQHSGLAALYSCTEEPCAFGAWELGILCGNESWAGLAVPDCWPLPQIVSITQLIQINLEINSSELCGSRTKTCDEPINLPGCAACSWGPVSFLGFSVSPAHTEESTQRPQIRIQAYGYFRNKLILLNRHYSFSLFQIMEKPIHTDYRAISYFE